LFADDEINNKDFGSFGNYWLEDCNEPNWCDGADLDRSGIVDYNDLRILAESWLSPFAAVPLWNDCWNNPRQCHGDADGQKQFGVYWVYTDDLDMLTGCQGYCPCVDFDRDGDVDEDDETILDTWFGVVGVPPDCPICPP
jgi:hypothetical protein